MCYKITSRVMDAKSRYEKFLYLFLFFFYFHFISWFILYLHIVFIISFLFFLLFFWQVIIWRNHYWISFFIYLYLFYFQVFLSISVLTVQYAAVRSTPLDLMIFNFFSAVLFFVCFLFLPFLTYFLFLFPSVQIEIPNCEGWECFCCDDKSFPTRGKRSKRS